MRPSLNILEPELIARILDEAMRVLAEVGMEIRGPEMRRRLLEHGLPLDHSGQRVLFPRDVVEKAITAGVVTGGMITKLEEAMAVINQGVGAIHILGKLAPGDLVRAVREPGSVGTTLVE